MVARVPVTARYLLMPLTLAINWPRGDKGVYRAHAAAAQVNGDVGLSRYAADANPL